MNNITSRISSQTFFLFAYVVCCLLHTDVEAQKKSVRPPNIIVILADDLGYADVGFNGCKDIPTPNIDRVANEGVRFTSGYVSFSVCSPSRAAMLTGRYSQRFGFERNPLYVPADPEMGLPLSEETLADVLGNNGYHNMIIGKWHLGAHPDLHPLKRGFHEFYGFLGGGHHYLPEKWDIQFPDSANGESESYRTWLNRDHTPVKETEYITDAFSREAVSFIERNKTQPFFLYLAYNAPHNPLQATPKYMNRFTSITDKRRQTYAAMVSAVDDGVGKVLARIDELQLAENTLIFFLSDNGGPGESNASNNGPLRSTKGYLFDGGIRVPFAFKWKGHVHAGMVYNDPIISLDIFATMVAEAGALPPLKNPIDGTNLMPYLNRSKKGSPHEALYWRHFDRKSYAVLHQDQSKLLRESDTLRLYSFRKNLSESENLLETSSVQAGTLQKKYDDWAKQLMKPRFWGLSQRKEYIESKGMKIKE